MGRTISDNTNTAQYGASQPTAFQVLEFSSDVRGYVSYNQFQQILQQHYLFVQQGLKGLIAEISIQPVKQTQFHQAVVKTWQLGSFRVFLPDNGKTLLSQVERLHIPFSFDPEQLSFFQQTTQALTQTLKWSFGPFVLIAAAVVPAILLGQLFKRTWHNRELFLQFKNAVKSDYWLKQSFDETIQLHKPRVQSALHQFLQGDNDLLVLEGPPGSGKSHLIETLAANIHGQGGTILLEVSKARIPILEALATLYQNGPQHHYGKTILNILKKCHISTGELDNILLLVDDLADVPHALMDLLVPATGRLHLSEDLPRLRFVASCHHLPNVSDRILNRLNRGRIFLDHRDSHYSVKTILPLFRSAFPDIKQTQLQEQLDKLLNEYPGYSIRTLIAEVKTAIHESTEGLSPNATPPLRDLVNTLKKRLNQTPLDASELSSLVRRFILSQMKTQQPYLSSKTRNCLAISLFRNRYKLTSMLAGLPLNGSEWKTMLENTSLHQPKTTFSTIPELLISQRNQLLETLHNLPLSILSRSTE